MYNGILICSFATLGLMVLSMTGDLCQTFETNFIRTVLLYMIKQEHNSVYTDW